MSSFFSPSVLPLGLQMEKERGKEKSRSICSWFSPQLCNSKEEVGAAIREGQRVEWDLTLIKHRWTPVALCMLAHLILTTTPRGNSSPIL